MKLNDVVHFLQLLRVGRIDVLSGGKWVKSSCPLAAATHTGGTDTNPSFGIKVNDEGFSFYNCFSCGTGTLHMLMHRLTWGVGISSDVHEFFMRAELIPSSASDPPLTSQFLDLYNNIPVGSDTQISVPDKVLEDYPLLKDVTGFEAKRCRKWFEERNIPLDVAYQYETRIAPEYRGIVFPIIDMDWKTYLLHFRSRIDKMFFYLTPLNTGFPDVLWGRKNFYYGIQFVDFTKSLIIVESETDLLRLRALGVENVIATCGPISKEKLSRIKSPVVYLGYDSDIEGAKYSYLTVKSLDPKTICYRLSWAFVGRKDAGELESREEFDEVWRNRKSIYYEGEGVGLRVELGEEINFNDKFANNYA